jgi:hypothetical protein
MDIVLLFYGHCTSLTTFDEQILFLEQVRDAHLKFMAETAVLLGSDNETAYEQMKEVLDFEAKLAQVMNGN